MQKYDVLFKIFATNFALDFILIHKKKIQFWKMMVFLLHQKKLQIKFQSENFE